MARRSKTNSDLMSRFVRWESLEAFFIGIVWAALGILVACAVLNLGVAIDSLALVTAFDMDEGLSGEFLRRALLTHSLNPHGFFNYGFSYIAAPYGVVRVLERLGYHASDHVIFYAGRAVSLVSYGVALAATYCAARRAGVGRVVSTLAVGMLGSVSSLSIYAQIFRPDLPQVASVALAFACLARPSTTALLSATAFAGVGFGLKYSGGFVLLPIAVSVALAEISRRPPWRGSALRRIALVLAIPAVFVGVWLVTNPYVISQWGAFRADLAFERGHVERGHHAIEPFGPGLWLRVFANDLPAPALAALVLGASVPFACHVASLIRRRRWPRLAGLRRAARSPRRRFLVAATSYVVITLLFLLVEVRMRRARYWMHILPVAVVVAAVGWERLLERLRARTRALVIGPAAIAVAGLLCATASARSDVANRMVDERVQLGEWVAEHYSFSTRIVADAYTYLPPHFTNVRTGGPPSHSTIAVFKPEVVILGRYSIGARCWMQLGTHFAQGRFDCGPLDGTATVRATLLWLASDQSGYVVERESSSFVVLTRKKTTQ